MFLYDCIFAGVFCTYALFQSEKSKKPQAITIQGLISAFRLISLGFGVWEYDEVLRRTPKSYSFISYIFLYFP